MQRRSKVGGILDRRFGENDPTMTPEQRALERFVKERQKGNRKGALFDLEDGDEENQLTHFGQSLFDNAIRNVDVREAEVDLLNGSSSDEGGESRPTKRRRLSRGSSIQEDAYGAGNEEHAERPKTRKEVMSEVIAKAKLHKHERQQAKEDDDDLRAELDKGLPDLFAMLRGTSRPSMPVQTANPNGMMNPDRAALLNGKDRSQADKEYDERMRQMVFDQRSKPTERTLTEEEKLHLEAQKLKELEEERLRRMKGEQDDSSENNEEGEQALQNNNDSNPNDEDAFGLGSGIPNPLQARKLGVEDEDDFVIEDNLVGSESELATSDDESHDGSSESSYDEYDDQEFVQDLLSPEDAGRAGLTHRSAQGDSLSIKDNTLAYTYPCPQNHKDLLLITKNIPLENFPIVVQRIRALYHPKLKSENKAKLAVFSGVLVDHVSYLANLSEHPSFAILETLIRHIHSLAKTFPEEVGGAFRSHLSLLHDNRPLAPNPGDLVLLTAVSSIFPTSDHFHQVVTPANLCMTRYLSQKIPNSLSDLAIGTYIGSLCLQYQRLSKRYIPELINYVLQAVLILSPAKMKVIPGSFPFHAPESPQYIEGRLKDSDHVIRRLKFWDNLTVEGDSEDSDEEFKLALLHTLLTLLSTSADLWADKSAFGEVFDPVSKILEHLRGKACSGRLPAETKVFLPPSLPLFMSPQTNNPPSNPKALLTHTLTRIRTHLHTSLLARRPLTLHTHRPLAIKTSIPKFEESYNPERHYDPDRDRAAASKLKAEYKKERKGALRELRKDASFMARENLKQKRERDAQYERKFKRLVAEIQGEEGREANEYEREKRSRKSRR